MSPGRAHAGADVVITAAMRAWVCDECGRLLGAHDGAWVKRLRRRTRARFGEAPDEARLQALVARFGEVSDFSYSTMGRFIAPSKTGIASSRDVDEAALLATVMARFPCEDPADVRTLVGWAVVWGYLR